MLGEIATKRMQKELLDLDRDPPPGITCFPKDDSINDLEAYIQGPPDSPYQTGLFKLSIQIPDRYPIQPPQIKFITSIYHPNIDDTGRICADILKGEWKPAINLGTALTSIRQLLAAPNPDDPLDADIAKEYQLDYPTFQRNATEFTEKYASKDAFNNEEEESSIQTPLTSAVVEEKTEEMIKKPKMSLSLSKKKSLITHSKDKDVTVDKIEYTKDTIPVKVTELESKNEIEKTPVDQSTILNNKKETMKKDKNKSSKSKKSDLDAVVTDNLNNMQIVNHAQLESAGKIEKAQKLKLSRLKKIELDSTITGNLSEVCPLIYTKSESKVNLESIHKLGKPKKNRIEKENISRLEIKHVPGTSKKNNIEKESTSVKDASKLDTKYVPGTSKKNNVEKECMSIKDTPKLNTEQRMKVDDCNIMINKEDNVKGKSKMNESMKIDIDDCYKNMSMDIDKEAVVILSDDDTDDSAMINNEPANKKRSLDLFFNQSIIALSDTDDDLFSKPVFHSLQLSKKLKRNKLSLSKKRRS